MGASPRHPSKAFVPGARCFFDTNILLYVVKGDDPRSPMATELLLQGGCISVQVLNEFANAARKKLKKSWGEIHEALVDIREACDSPLSLTLMTHEAALRIASRYGFNIYDSLILASAIEAGCDVLYSEDMQDGQKIDGLTIRNPFV